jgi:hypothetical protein
MNKDQSTNTHTMPNSNSWQDDFLKIDHFKDKHGENLTEFKEHEGKLIIKQYSGINMDNYIIKKYDKSDISKHPKKLSFSFCRLNGIYYINLNGEHMIDYKKFVNIQQISNTVINDIPCVKLKNNYIGDIILENCDTEILHKSLEIMNKYMKNKSNKFFDFMYLITNL